MLKKFSEEPPEWLAQKKREKKTQAKLA